MANGAVIFNLADAETRPLIVPEEILGGGALDVDSKLLITGAAKVGKSFLGIWLGLCLAEGKRPFLQWPVVKTRRVLYLQLEIGANRMEQRARLLGEAFNDEAKGRFWAWTQRDFHIIREAPIARQFVEANQISVVILDPLYLLHDANENDNSEMAVILRVMDTFLQFCDAIVLIHHHGHRGDARGATNLKGWPDSWIKLDGEKPTRLKVASWLRNSDNDDTFEIGLKKEPMRFELLEPAEAAEESVVMAQLPGRMKEMAQQLGWSETKTWRRLSALREKGLVENRGGIWLSS